MPAEIVLQIFRFGFLLLLWLFIFAAFRVVRADLFGGRAGRVASVPPRAAAPGKKKGRGGPKTLVVTAGPLTGTKITLGDQPILIGRGTEADIRLPDTGVSRKHVDVVLEGGVATAEDLGSTNGTLVNGRRISRQALSDGDVIRIGHSVLVYRQDGA